MSYIAKYILLLCILLPLSTSLNSPNIGNVYPINFTPVSISSIIRYYNTSSFIQDLNQNVFMSTDNGLTWSQLENVQSNQMFFDSDSNTVLFQNVDSSCSTNNTILHYYDITSGELSEESFDGCFDTISQHPVSFDFLVTVVNNSYIMVSTDFGQSWKQITNSSQTVTETPIWDSSSTGGLFLLVDNNVTSTLYYTVDFGNTIQQLLLNVSIFAHSKYTHYWALTGSNQLYIVNSTNAIPVSLYDNGKQVNIYDLLIIVDDNPNNGAYITAYQYGEQVADVFQYDGNDGAFDLVFNGIFYGRNVNGNDYWADFIPLQTMPGYMALNGISPSNNNSFITYYTIDNGANWNQFNDSNGNNINFFGYLSYNVNHISPLYSSPFSLGLSVGNGMIGQILFNQTSYDQVNTYLSRNSGYNWDLIYPSESIFKLGNYGNFLVLVPKPNPQNLLYYSIDQGLTYQNLSLPDQVNGVDIYGILTNINDNQQMTFTFLYHLNSTNGTDEAAVFSIDFSTLNYPYCDNSDFEIVDMYGNSTSTSCVDGLVTTFYRRKQDAQCITVNEPGQVSSNSCTCTYNDFECDIGYIKVDGPNPLNCNATNPNSNLNPQQPANCPTGQSYIISKGYKRIFGDICINGVASQLDPLKFACINPGSSSSDSSSSSDEGPNKEKHNHAGVVIGTIVSFFFVVFVVIFIMYKFPQLRNRCSSNNYSKLPNDSDSEL